MKVEQLIKALQQLPQGADVEYIFDGAARGSADIVWLTADGRVIIADDGDIVHDAVDKPAMMTSDQACITDEWCQKRLHKHLNDILQSSSLNDHPDA